MTRHSYTNYDLSTHICAPDYETWLLATMRSVKLSRQNNAIQAETFKIKPRFSYGLADVHTISIVTVALKMFKYF